MYHGSSLSYVRATIRLAEHAALRAAVDLVVLQQRLSRGADDDTVPVRVDDLVLLDSMQGSALASTD